MVAMENDVNFSLRLFLRLLLLRHQTVIAILKGELLRVQGSTHGSNYAITCLEAVDVISFAYHGG